MPLASLRGIAVDVLGHGRDIGALAQPTYADEIVDTDQRTAQIGVFRVPCETRAIIDRCKAHLMAIGQEKGRKIAVRKC